ncbi:MAG: DEAD/DEAH box helicase, partial [Armatimonadota bacterium]
MSIRISMNPFTVLEQLQEDYRTFVIGSQPIKSNDVLKAMDEEIEHGDLLWKDPYVQIARRWKHAGPITDLIKEGLLHPDCAKVFYTGDNKETGNPINLYTHQYKAIKAYLEGKNYLISTGTSSGKSYCFFIPIVDTCLKMRGTKGIKAIVIYPMNSLANSQYWNMVRRLEGTGIKVGKYTGQTETSDQKAIEAYRQVFGKQEPLDSEVLSREEMRRNPPDILITNYKMLEYMLIREADWNMLDPTYADALRFIVMDETHTYEGRRGADVAILIRRVKRRMRVRGKIRCIATSATIVSESDAQKAREEVSQFFEQLFGEPLGEYITEEEEQLPPLDFPIPSTLPDELDLIESFRKNASEQCVWDLAETLLGRTLQPHERNPLSLKSLLERYEGYHFLFEHLAERPKQVKELARELRKKRSDLSENQAKFCILGTLNLGTVESDSQQLIPFKLHVFFQSGAIAHRCLKCNHISLRGESHCPECKAPMFPLHFCRACGAELVGITLDWNQREIEPWKMNQEEKLEEAGYLLIASEENEIERAFENVPDNWRKADGNPKKGYENRFPVRVSVDPDTHTIQKIESRPDKQGILGVFIAAPMKMCPACGILRTEHSGDWNKLGYGTYIGRSTAIDILTLAMLKAKPDPGKTSSLIFCDARQDAALQAGNMDDWYRHVLFRSTLRKVLEEAPPKEWDIRNCAERLFERLEKDGLFDLYIPHEKLTSTKAQKILVEYLRYCILDDIAISRYYTDVNLEEVGLMSVEYEGLDKLVSETLSHFDGLNKDQLHDLYRAILDDFRHEKAYSHEAWTKYDRFWENVKKVISSDGNQGEPFLIPQNSPKPTCFTTQAEKSDAVAAKVLSPTRTLGTWVKRNDADSGG